MTHWTEVTVALVGAATFIFTFIVGPAARAALRARAADREAATREREAVIAQADEDRRYRRETHQALMGIPEKRDDSGALIEESKPGLVAGYKQLQVDMTALRAEFPVNGVPTRAAIDLANQNIASLRDEVKRVDNKADATISALGSAGIRVNAPKVPRQRRPREDQR